MTDNPAALWGGKSYRDSNTKKIQKQSMKKGLPVIWSSRESARLLGPYLAKYGEKTINPRARRCRQGKAAPATVRIQHRGRSHRVSGEES